MSTAAVSGRRLLPPEVSNLLASWWLALGSSAVLALVLWPELPLPETFVPMKGFMLGTLLFLLAAVGVIVASGVVRARPAMWTVGKWVLLIGMGLGLAVTVWTVVARLQSPPDTKFGPVPSFLGPSAVLSATLLAVTLIIPILFGVMTLSFANADEVERFFYPPPPVTVQTEALVVNRQELGALLAGEGLAGAAALSVADPVAEILAVGESIENAERRTGGADAALLAGEASATDVVEEVVETVEEVQESRREDSTMKSDEMSLAVDESLLLDDLDVTAPAPPPAAAVPTPAAAKPPEPAAPPSHGFDEPLSVGDLDLFDDEKK